MLFDAQALLVTESVSVSAELAKSGAGIVYL